MLRRLPGIYDSIIVQNYEKTNGFIYDWGASLDF